MVVGHKMMIADRVRTGAYQKAILETVREGDTVVDLGTGTGILAFFACQAGARRVYAIERGEIIEVAKEIARANGLEKRIVFIKDVSTEVSLPEKVDVIISELIGCFALEENLLHFIPDARDRFLEPKGILIPSSIQMFLVPIEASDTYEEIDFCTGNVYGVNFLPVRETTINSSYNEWADPRGFLSSPLSINKIDFYELDGEIRLDSAISFEAKRPGTLHGLVGWFEAQLSKDIVLSTAPDKPVTHWENTFFPVRKPVVVLEGDSIEVNFRAIPEGKNIIWSWGVKVLGKNGSLARASFEHSTWRRSIFSKGSLTKQSINFSPSLNETGKIELFILSLCDGKTTVQKIAKELCEQYPQTYDRIEKALSKVNKVVKNRSLAPSEGDQKGIINKSIEVS